MKNQYMDQILEHYFKHIDKNDLEKYIGDLDHNFSIEYMKSRGRELVGYESTIRVTQEDIIDSLKYSDSDFGIHRVINTIGPGYGKTTSIRKFILDNLYSTFGIYSTNLRSDAIKMLYDLQCTYLYRYDTLIDNIVCFIDTDKWTIEELQRSNWIICTHIRLMIEAPLILFDVDQNLNDIMDSIISRKRRTPSVRSILIVDEFPTNVYSKLYTNSDEAVSLTSFHISNMRLKDDKRPQELIDYQRRKSYEDFINEMYDKDSKLYNDPSRIKIMSNLPSGLSDKSKSVYENDRSYIKNDINKELINIHKLRYIYHTTCRGEKLYQNIESLNPKNTILFSLNELLIDNITIFDGTADILVKDSNIWKVIYNEKFRRKLYINPDYFTYGISVNRSSDINEIISEFNSILVDINQRLPNSKILVYTWKTNSIGESIPDKLLESLPISIRDKFKIITYQSGQERVTSEFVSYNTVVILGKFFIPNDAISNLSNSLGTSISNKDYTISLIDQFINRSSNRIEKPINFSISNDLSDITQDIFKTFELHITNNEDKLNEIKVITDVVFDNLRNKNPKIELHSKVLNSIYKSDLGSFETYIDKNDKIHNNQLCKVISFPDLKNVLKINMRDVKKVKDYLRSKCYVDYKFIEGINKSKTNPNKFMIFFNNSLLSEVNS